MWGFPPGAAGADAPRRAQTQRVPRKEIKPADYKFNIDTPYDEGEVVEAPRSRRRGGVQQQQQRR